MGVKIYYKSPIVWNMILYSLFSLTFIYFQNIYRFNTSILDEEFYLQFLKSNWPYISLVGLTVFSFLNNLKRFALILYLVMIGVTLAVTTYYLFLDFSKLPLILLFFYLLFGFYLFQFYSAEIEESYYNPLFHKADLFKPTNDFAKVKISKDLEEEKFDAILTNWSKEGCFLYFDEPKNLKGNYFLEVEFRGLNFIQKANLISTTSAKDGHGFKFKDGVRNNPNNSLGWNNFYEIINELGYEPELLK